MTRDCLCPTNRPHRVEALEPPEVSVSITRYRGLCDALEWLLAPRRAATETWAPGSRHPDQKRGNEHLWPIVQTELKCARGLLISCRQRLHSKPSNTVTAFDACEAGNASCEAELDVSACNATCSWLERWRCMDEEQPVKASFRERRHWFECRMRELVGETPESLWPRTEWCEDAFPGLVRKAMRHCRHYTPRHDHEPAHVKEIRGLMAVVRRRVLESDAWNERTLVLGGNLGERREEVDGQSL